jgi:penicillin-binding protein 1C
MLLTMRRRHAIVIGAAALVCLAVWTRLGPIPEGLLDERPGVSTVVVDRAGVVLYEAPSPDGTRATRLDAGRLPPALVAATLAAEDRRFFSHAGVDPLSLARAAWRDLLAGGRVQGGSTISQQVAKLLLARQARREHRDRATAAAAGNGADRSAPTTARSRGLLAKVREAIVAIRLERRLDKQHILALYLNLAPYGNQFVGAERASRGYFGCPAASLTPAQAAFLAGLPQRPSGFNPYRSLRAALGRQKQILQRMVAAGSISETGAAEAFGERLQLNREPAAFLAPHFVEMVLSSYGDARPARVETTLDAGLQEDVAGIIRSARADLVAHGAHNVSVVVLGNASGEWLAWEGSGDYFDADHGGAINGPTVPRQPGSALKPFTYARAFEQGYTPASLLPDIPSHFPTAEPGIVYTPRNYDGRFRGPLLARCALAGSENVPAVALASEIGVPELLRFLRRAGLTTFDKIAAYYGLGLTLGDAEVRLDELVAAYASLARGGVAVRPTAVPCSGCGGGDGTGVGAAEAGPERLMSNRTAFWISDILSDADAREYIFGRGGSLEFPFPVAAKTGTSQAYRDNWAIGYTRDVTVGVWVGNFDRTPLRTSSGVTGAGPIFHAVMLVAQKRFASRAAETLGQPIVLVPAGVLPRRICTLSGMMANPSCPSRRLEWLPVDASPLPCSWHHASDEGLLTVWPPEYRAWAREHGLADSERVAAWTETPSMRVPGWEPTKPSRISRPVPLRILNPPQDATYLIDPTLRAEFQTLALRAVASQRVRVTWSIDGRPVGSIDSDRDLDWPLVHGRHRVSARDEAGHADEVTIRVK